jgi:aspartate carbamoyltransferase
MKFDQSSPFKSKTIQVVRDLSYDEQWFLYQKTRELKEAIRSKQPLDQFALNDPSIGVYLLFLEDSTRTKESFRNAAKFHGAKVNDFDGDSSSFKKKENITDTIKMLFGYSDFSVFVLRTKTEGVCRWLEASIGNYANKIGLPKPAFINGGDGRHEHPTQEYLDEFSFLEQNQWDRSYIHIALVGDLFHGRTIHSKVDGLGIFNQVKVDLIAPQEIMMPPHYVKGMIERGYEVTVYESLDEYIKQKTNKIASIWYFTRLQLERMGEKLQDKAAYLRKAVTFQREHMASIPEHTRFFHPLPRHSATPTIPMFLDETPLNGWDEQSRNGYFIRINLLGMVTGKIGYDFQGGQSKQPDYSGPYVQSTEIIIKKKREYKIGIRPVEEGIVIDHIGRGKDPREIWEHITTIRRLLDLNNVSSHGVYLSESEGIYKGIISVPGDNQSKPVDFQTLAAVAPGSTVNIIADGKVKEKYRLKMPPRVSQIPGMMCKNPDCISRPELHEPIYPDFVKSEDDRFLCHYCETPHTFNEIWVQNWNEIS